MKRRSMVEYQMNLLHQIFVSQTEEAEDLLKQLDPSFQGDLDGEVLEEQEDDHTIQYSNHYHSTPPRILNSTPTTQPSKPREQKQLENPKREDIKSKFLVEMQKNADYKALQLIKKLNDDRKKTEARFIKAKQRVNPGFNSRTQLISESDKVQQLKPKPLQRYLSNAPKSKFSMQPRPLPSTSVPKTTTKPNKTWVHLAMRDILFQIVTKIVRTSGSNKKQPSTKIELDLVQHIYYKSKFRIEIEERQREIRERRYHSLASKPQSLKKLDKGKSQVEEVVREVVGIKGMKGKSNSVNVFEDFDGKE